VSMDQTESVPTAEFEASRVDRDRTLQAVRLLEAALAKAAEGSTWMAEVVAALEVLQAAMSDERRELNRPDSLLALISAEHPRRFSTRVRNLRARYDDITRQVASLSDQLAGDAEMRPDPGDLRHRIGWIVNALHQCRGRQTDLVYEAIAMDLGAH
jgi:hypothetical protein